MQHLLDAADRELYEVKARSKQGKVKTTQRYPNP